MGLARWLGGLVFCAAGFHDIQIYKGRGGQWRFMYCARHCGWRS